MSSINFSEPQPTVEAAQSFHEYELFNPGAVFDTGAGFVYARIREMESPPRETARAILDATGYTLVAHHGALLPVWQEYKEQPI